MGKLENLTPQKQTGNKLLMGLSAEFSKRFMAVEQVHLLAMATLLDPRFKKMYFKNAVVCSKHVNYFSGLITKHVTQQEQIDSSSSDSEPAGFGGLFSEHNKYVQKKWRIQEEGELRAQPSLLNPELSLYLGAPAEKIQQNPVLFWKHM